MRHDHAAYVLLLAIDSPQILRCAPSPAHELVSLASASVGRIAALIHVLNRVAGHSSVAFSAGVVEDSWRRDGCLDALILPEMAAPFPSYLRLSQ
jgi:hypothetical protein